MLAGVLLHVVAPAAPVDVPPHRSSRQKRLRRGVPNLSALILFHRENRSLEQSAAQRGGGERAGVVRLAAAGGVKGTAVQGDLPQRSALSPGDLADVGNMRVKAGQ